MHTHHQPVHCRQAPLQRVPIVTPVQLHCSQPAWYRAKQNHLLQPAHEQQQHMQPIHSLVCLAATHDSQPSTAAELPALPNTSQRQKSIEEPLLTFAEVQQIAAARGLHISLKTLGPGYRIVCRDGEARKHAPTAIVSCTRLSAGIISNVCNRNSSCL